MPVGTQNHVSTTPTVTTVRPAFRDEFFPAKTHAAAAAVSSPGKNFDPINEHCISMLPSARTDVIPSGTKDPTFNCGSHDLPPIVKRETLHFVQDDPG